MEYEKWGGVYGREYGMRWPNGARYVLCYLKIQWGKTCFWCTLLVDCARAHRPVPLNYDVDVNYVKISNGVWEGGVCVWDGVSGAMAQWGTM